MPDHSRSRPARAPSSSGSPATARAGTSRQDRLGNAGVREVRRAPAQTAGPEGAVLEEARRGVSAALPFRAELEASFGADLSEVVAWLGVDLDGIDGAAAASGSEVFFSTMNPDRVQVAEEVAHVLQQHRGQGVSRPGDTSEREAVSAATHAARGESVEVESESDGNGVHRDAALPSRSTDVKKLKLAPGTTYTVTGKDMEAGEAGAWKRIADALGMKVGHLAAFNTHVQSVGEANGGTPQRVTPTLAAGIQLYVPSSAEILYGQCVEQAGGIDSGTNLYVTVSKGANDEVMKAARSRASGETGESYGVAGVGGLFYTPNPDLAGAKKKAEKVDGRTEYKVNWGSDFWKCSVFMNDVVFQAGWKPAITDNKHYSTAGNAETSGAYNIVSVAKAQPGHLWQRDGGGGSDQSHNAVLSSFVTVENVDEEIDLWKFDIVGAEQGRAAESEQTYRMKKGTNTMADYPKTVRFLAPKAKR
ncbi:MAG: hypothetical protein Q8P41_04710 [Pseudomonadota bacterium]|nr:hypothetical protein [Pseudomonadota bacterium]